MKIVFFEVCEKEKETLNNFFKDLEIVFINEKLSENNAAFFGDAEIISVFVNSEINRKIIDLLPNLKFITTRSTGYDHIDIEYCLAKNIKVSNVPAYGSRTVAEFAFSLLLALSRKIFDAVLQTKQESDFSIHNLEGFDLNNKTIGIIGTGKIGKNVIKIALGFGMKVIAYDLYPDMDFAQKNNFEYKSLEDLLSTADIITLHAPLTKENHYLINKENIAKMKKGVFIINTARGELIETESLIWGLKEKIIAGAGLDVLEGERILKEDISMLSACEKKQRIEDYKILLENHLLADMPNVIVTPHIAFYSREAVEEITRVTESNINFFIQNNPQNLIK
jgi:D-lactate dehydrogenase